VNEPKVLLLDEPLGALDLKLREQMQEELKQLQQQLGITFVFVTHDQGEALAMANRIAIFNEGRIMQAGTPAAVYERPQSRFVADFVGSSNVLSPEFSAAHGGPPAWASLRPEKISVTGMDQATPEGLMSAEGKVTSVQYQGAVTRISLLSNGTKLAAVVPSGAARFAVGDAARFNWSGENLVLMEQP
jgi:putative spermidine/putrescine transport system ATP-binding protein